MKRCTVPMPRNGKLMDEDGTYYLCDRPAKFKVGFWYVCDKHEKYYTTPNGWNAEPLPLNEEELNETV